MDLLTPTRQLGGSLPNHG